MKRAFIKGNDAVICGALCAGCRAFFGYPITPASEIAHDAMKAFPDAGALAIQAESEVAAINMLYGAAATGTAAMTATSGPGFSLMQEGISYMAAARLPGVIVDIMRSGPGLGNIGPEQGDYFVATHGGGHGHYQTPVLAPASVEEMFTFTQYAFELAFKYRVPVIVLADAFIGQMMETLEIPDKMPESQETPATQYPLENAVCGNAESMGNIVSSLELVPQKLHLKNDSRFKTYSEIESDISPEFMPEIDFCETEFCDTLVIGFGICARIAHEAVMQAHEKGLSVGFFRPKVLWPFPDDKLRQCVQHVKRILVVECNRGQMIQDVERIVYKTSPNIQIDSIQTDGGLIPTVNDIFHKLL